MPLRAKGPEAKLRKNILCGKTAKAALNHLTRCPLRTFSADLAVGVGKPYPVVYQVGQLDRKLRVSGGKHRLVLLTLTYPVSPG